MLTPRRADRGDRGARGRRSRARRVARRRSTRASSGRAASREKTREEAEESGEETEDAERGQEPSEAETEAVTGVLDRMPQGYGFLRLSGLHEAEGDVYVSASQIRRCELRPGDEVSRPGAGSPAAASATAPWSGSSRSTAQSPEEERRALRGPDRRRRRTAGCSPPDAEPIRWSARSTCSARSPSASGCSSSPQPRSGRTTLLRALGRGDRRRPTRTSASCSPTSARRRSRSGSAGPARGGDLRRDRRSRSHATRSARPSWRWATPSASPRRAGTSSS